MIAATAATAGLPLYTTNPDDFVGLGGVVRVVGVPHPTTREGGPEPSAR